MNKVAGDGEEDDFGVIVGVLFVLPLLAVLLQLLLVDNENDNWFDNNDDESVAEWIDISFGLIMKEDDDDNISFRFSIYNK